MEALGPRVQIPEGRVDPRPLRVSPDLSSPLSPAAPPLSPCLHLSLKSLSTLEPAREKEDRTFKLHKMSDAYEREQYVSLRPVDTAGWCPELSRLPDLLYSSPHFSSARIANIHSIGRTMRSSMASRPKSQLFDPSQSTSMTMRGIKV